MTEPDFERLAQTIADDDAPFASREGATEHVRRRNENLESGAGKVWGSGALLSALAQVATDESQLPSLQDAAGEALAVTWLNRGAIDADVYTRLATHAQLVVDNLIRSNAPELLPASAD